MTKYQHISIPFRYLNTLIILFLLLPSIASHAEEAPEPVVGSPATDSIDSKSITNTLDILTGFARVRDQLQKDIKLLNRKISTADSDNEKKILRQDLDKHQTDLQTTIQNMENIAVGVDISRLKTEKEEEFNFQKEIFSLLKPAIDEMKQMTYHIRQKSAMREKISSFEENLPVIEKVLSNIARLRENSKDKLLNQSLKQTEDVWRKKQAFMQSELKATHLQLNELESSEVSIAEASRNYIKTFFKKRGLYIAEALALVVVILLLSKLSYTAMQRHLPGFRRKHRSFRIRLIELVHRTLTFIMVVLGPMVVFYLVEDWVLFSLGILLLLGVILALRKTLPLYWHQAQLFLNVGSVREGERIQMDGLPWEVQQINFFCTLYNPTAAISQRIPITGLVGLKSRVAQFNEPWFPCRKDDWVLLSDGVRGKVIGISPEMVQLVERGGAELTYLTSDFLANSPRNLATSFRIKEIIGISYSLQKISTKEIPEILHRYVLLRSEQEGYADKLLNLRVEFAQANSSSLDVVVIADFKGELGDLYNRLRRAIQRWCVDACTENDWEIPFQQITLHGENTLSLPDSTSSVADN